MGDNAISICRLGMDGAAAMLARFGAARSGSVATMFALSLVPISLALGAAVDYRFANNARSHLNAAADAAALSAVASSSMSVTAGDAEKAAKKFFEAQALNIKRVTVKTVSVKVTENKKSGRVAVVAYTATLGATTKDIDTLVANTYFKALFTRPEATNIVLNIAYTVTDGSKVKVNASGDVKTDFMQLMGFQKLRVAVDSVARWGTTKMQIALALDTTGSMAWDSKMPALKTATKQLLTTLQTAATTNGDVRVAIVPFAKHVRVDPATYYNANWIDWEDWDDDNGHDTSTTTCSGKKTGKSGKSTKKCTTTTTWVPDNHNTWNGCITDRDRSPGDYDIKNTTPTVSTPSTLYPAQQASDCPAKMMGLSYDWNALKNKVDELQPDGYTNQPIVLHWAWMALTSGVPLSPPAKTADTQQAIILFSDGLNTQNRWWQEQEPIDNRQALLCANRKAAGITIYTVLVNSGYSKVMKDCASKPEY